MPYNTRRKSLSLPSLGIHVPNSSRRSPALSKPTHNNPADPQLPSSKRVKRSHEPSSQSPEPQSSGLKAESNAARPNKKNIHHHTPPPSPVNGEIPHKIDTDGINDDVVVAVIEQLEKTGNRPHLVKELAAVLVTFNDNVANSANPAALLSSRLTTYLKRPWTALAPCPLVKELVPVHPRRVYYYLTTLPRQPLPDNSDDLIVPGVDDNRATPSVSSVDQDEEDARAWERSPSPEVDLSSPDFDDDMNARAGASRPHHGFSANNHRHHPRRAVSPPLEGDEREFTQTASAVRERASGAKTARLDEPEVGGSNIATSDDAMTDETSGSSPMEDDPLSPASGDRVSGDQYGDYFSHMGSRHEEHDLDDFGAAAVTLFGTSPSPSLSSTASSVASSASPPTEIDGDSGDSPDTADRSGMGMGLKRSFDDVRVADDKQPIDVADPLMSDLATWDEKVSPVGARPSSADMDIDLITDSWAELQSPETVEVDELDEMFGEI